MFKKAERIKELEEENEELQGEIDRLTERLEIYKHVDEIKVGLTADISGLTASITSANLKLGDDVARYVDDYFGGQVLKQEANNVTVLDTSGRATYHKTREAVDKGYSYKLVRPSPAP